MVKISHRGGGPDQGGTHIPTLKTLDGGLINLTTRLSQAFLVLGDGGKTSLGVKELVQGG